MSKLQNDLEKIDLSDCGNLKATVQKLVGSEAVEDFLRRLADRSKFTEFSTKHHGFSQATVSDAVDIFIETGDLQECENFILSNYDSSDALHDLVQDTMNSVGYTNLIASVSNRAAKRFPESAQRLENMIVDIVLDQLINMIKEKDKSRPLDLLRNVFVTVAYLPMLKNHGQEIPCTSAITSEQDCISIIPNDIFKSFLQAANVDKENWIDAVESHINMRLDSNDSPLKDMWQKARWTVQGKPVVDVARLVEAVDACRYGFTPLVAFSIDAYKFGPDPRLEKRIFSHGGGVIGLHDFRYGSGAPLRFEGTVEIIACPQDFIQPEKKMYGLSESHGFTNISYLSKIRRRTESMMIVLHCQLHRC